MDDASDIVTPVVLKRPWKAYSTVIGGFINMLVSALTLNTFKWLGSSYSVSFLAPYVASYYNIPVTETQYIIPTIAIVNCCFVFLGSRLC